MGQAGATVYVKGRSAANTYSPYGGSIGETAELVTKSGGKGIPIIDDYADDDAVENLFARVKQEHGKLDILLNNAAKVANQATGGFWEKPLDVADLITVGLPPTMFPAITQHQ